MFAMTGLFSNFAKVSPVSTPLYDMNGHSRGETFLMRFMIGILLVCATTTMAAETVGWRGDGSGRYPDADPPTQWGRISKTLKGLRASTKKPANDTPDGQSVADGVIHDWLVLGPVAAPEETGAFDKETITGEADLAPAENEKSGSQTWKPAHFETAVIEFKKSFSGKQKSFVYACAYLYSESAASVRANLTHNGAVKLWVNGKLAYKATDNAGDRVKCDLNKGWNRVLFKSGSESEVVSVLYGCAPGEYEQNGIAWAALMPNIGYGAPILVGDKIFVTAEPDLLLCLNKSDGKILWTRSNSYYDAASDSEKSSIKEAAGLLDQLRAVDRDVLAGKISYTEASETRAKTEKSLGDVVGKGRQEYRACKLPPVGYAGLTPTSDGKSVYVWFNHGVAACYDLEGNRRWIRVQNTHPGDEHGCATSPLLVANKLIVFADDFIAFDAATGEVAWRFPIGDRKSANYWKCHIYGSLSRGTIAGTDVAFAPNGWVIRASDGKVLFNDERLHPGSEIPTPVMSDGKVYKLNTPGGPLFEIKFPDTLSEPLVPAAFKQIEVPKYPIGYESNAFMASPLVHEGLVYMMNANGSLGVVDTEKATGVYDKLLDLDIFYSKKEEAARGVGISPTLGGKYIYLMGNANTTLVIQPGREFKLIAKNRIEQPACVGSAVERQERTAACPIFEGKRMYYRSENYLYCIGEK
jgi:outer membrane protein assembly factor BamB